jgi:Tol biopolymer transport system component
VGPPASYRGLALSPDGQRIVFHREDTIGTGDLWVHDLVRGSTSRLTFDPENHNMAPVWSHDGRHIIFTKFSGGASWGIFEKDASGVGNERLLYASKERAVIPWSVSPNGATLVFSERDPDTNYDLYTLPLADRAKPSLYFRAPDSQVFGQFSPDGRWLAYASGESGRGELYVTSFPQPVSRYQVSTNGGAQPQWRRDGRELFFRPIRTGGFVSMMAVGVDAAADALRLGVPKPIFEGTVSTVTHAQPIFTYAVTPDGQRFLVSRVPGEGGSEVETPLAVVVNWDAALPR